MAYCSTDLFKIFPFSIDNYVCLFIYLLFFFFFSLSSKNCHRCAKKKVAMKYDIADNLT